MKQQDIDDLEDQIKVIPDVENAIREVRSYALESDYIFLR